MHQQVPLVDLRAQYLPLKDEFMAAFEQILDSMHLFLGPWQQRFEHDFAAYSDCQYGVTVSNGTDALALALRACDIGPGDEVITVSNTFIATVEAIAMVGATPVFVDIDPETYLMDWRQLEQILTSRSRVLMPVHLYGHVAEMEPIMEFAHAHGLRVIEDASQSHGATYKGRRAGSFGDIGCFSCYFSKNIGAFGEAGICTTNDAGLAEKMKMIRDHGSREKYRHELMGVNCRMDEMQAAVLQIKLSHLEGWNAARRTHAQFYAEQLQDVVRAIPVEKSWASHVYCYYVVQVPDRDHLVKSLAQDGIGTAIHYPIPIHLQPACACYGYGPGALPVTEDVTSRILSLPMYPELTEVQQMLVVNSIKKNIMSDASRV